MTTRDNIKLPFPLGSTAWVARNVGAHREIICPECNGARIVKVVTATGEYKVDCEGCSWGCVTHGWITEHTIDVQPVEVVLADVSYEYGRVTYLTPREPDGGQYVYPQAELRATREECLALCAELAARLRQEKEARDLANLMSKRKNCAHTAIYWKRKANELRQDLDRVLRRIGQLGEQDAKKKEPTT